jgi:IclR family KDG regulon transcriptional repressor
MEIRHHREQDDVMGRAVPAASRALDILELFLDDPVLSAADVVSRLALPRTTVHELLSTLADRSYLVVVPGQPLRYQLGVRLFQLGSVFAQQLDLAREAQRVATEIASECDETVHVAVREGADVIYIARVESTHPVRMVSAVGRRLPAHCTGVGKMLLSDLSTQQLNALYPKGSALTTMTPSSISSLSRLRTELTEIRERGLSYDECESSEDVHCVAAGARDHTGAMVAGLSISVPTTRWDDSRRQGLAKLAREGAERLSASLGYRDAAAR